MTFLRRVLNADAAMWAIFGLVVGIAPGWLLETVAGQPPLIDDAWIRALGVIAVVLALLMVLVAQRLEDVWWWAWAFVRPGGGDRHRVLPPRARSGCRTASRRGRGGCSRA